MRITENLDLSLTVFVVGRDAENKDNIPWLKKIVSAGHDLGNHSYSHEPWMHETSIKSMVEEVSKAEKAIQAATGQKTIVFRGPGFAVSKNLLTILNDMGYVYDASVCSNIPSPDYSAGISARGSITQD